MYLYIIILSLKQLVDPKTNEWANWDPLTLPIQVHFYLISFIAILRNARELLIYTYILHTNPTISGSHKQFSHYTIHRYNTYIYSSLYYTV